LALIRSLIFGNGTRLVQFPTDGVLAEGAAQQDFDVRARIKFEGPDFSHGKAGQANSISIVCVTLVRATSKG
jgi:hypothetical protein